MTTPWLRSALSVALAGALASWAPSVLADGRDAEEPHYLRAAGEMALTLGAGTIWYWIDDRNVLDWDRPSIDERLSGAAYRFDNNGFAMNFLLHPLSGAGWYALSRANGLSVPASAGYSLATSLVWEVGIEFNEKVSINDLIATPLGGVALGEFFHKLALYVNTPHGAPSALQRTAGWLLGPTIALHDALDGRERRAERADALGFSADIWHRFRAGYSLGTSDSSRGTSTLQRLSFGGTLATLDGYRRAGHRSRGFYGAEIASLEGAASSSGHGAGLTLTADTVLAGYLDERLAASESGLFGTSALVGTSVAFEYRVGRTAGFRERLSVVHLPGLAAEWSVERGPLRTAFTARAHADFAGVGSLAYPTWEVENTAAREKSILRKQGYYYGFGGSLALGGSFELDPIALTGRIRTSAYASTEGLDRAQHLVTDDLTLSDAVSEYEAGLELKTSELVRFGLRGASRAVRSRAAAVRVRERVDEVTAELALVF